MLIPVNILKEITGELLKVSAELLEKEKKIATGATYDSLGVFFGSTDKSATLGVQGSEGLQYIIDGREAGGKMPVQKVGDEFEPFPRMQEWFDVKGTEEEFYFPIMRKIADEGIEPVDLPGMIAGEATNITERILLRAIPSVYEKETAAELRNLYNKK